MALIDTAAQTRAEVAIIARKRERSTKLITSKGGRTTATKGLTSTASCAAPSSSSGVGYGITAAF